MQPHQTIKIHRTKPSETKETRSTTIEIIEKKTIESIEIYRTYTQNHRTNQAPPLFFVVLGRLLEGSAGVLQRIVVVPRALWQAAGKGRQRWLQQMPCDDPGLVTGYYHYLGCEKTRICCVFSQKKTGIPTTNWIIYVYGNHIYGSWGL